ncbi:MAG TPA: MarC family protein [Dehalococcoidia bacterium]|nr:MarC family protein [Dehalococcoidia bacterium]
MSEFVGLLLTFLVILNPPAALLTWRSLSADLAGGERWTMLAGGIALGTIGLIVAALLGDDIIDALDISLSSFQVGTALLLILGVLRVFVTRNPWAAPEYSGRFRPGIAALRLALWIATPASLAAAAFYAADRGESEAVAPLLLALMITAAAIVGGYWLKGDTPSLVLREAGRLIAIVLVVLAVDLLFDGITRV